MRTRVDAIHRVLSFTETRRLWGRYPTAGIWRMYFARSLICSRLRLLWSIERIATLTTRMPVTSHIRVHLGTNRRGVESRDGATERARIPPASQRSSG